MATRSPTFGSATCLFPPPDHHVRPASPEAFARATERPPLARRPERWDRARAHAGPPVRPSAMSGGVLSCARACGAASTVARRVFARARGQNVPHSRGLWKPVTVLQNAKNVTALAMSLRPAIAAFTITPLAATARPNVELGSHELVPCATGHRPSKAPGAPKRRPSVRVGLERYSGGGGKMRQTARSSCDSEVLVRIAVER